jgi:hypothetical protein
MLTCRARTSRSRSASRRWGLHERPEGSCRGRQAPDLEKRRRDPLGVRAVS